jgi:hypothetical protein
MSNRASPTPQRGVECFNISGRVVNAKRNEPMVGATVVAQGQPNVVVIADEQGAFTIESKHAVSQLDVYLSDDQWTVNLDRCADVVFRLTPGPPTTVIPL